ncbi:homoserine kinase [Rariglobus hedericola]|uniref:Homoserine kinase n=1 Tax=Rariglobus hedericola TaxID=2597822 RepID=A0A556QMX5_9BACT|nr:homoserine kinase [Rariglobus hedericola]TSJ77998.1 homoserine kinase [Rariglobus hedericola]
MSTLLSTVTVRVPGSTSNCGAGFDTLGLALQIYNQVTLTRVDGDAPRPVTAADGRAQAMVETSAAAFFAAARIRPFGFSYQITGDVPPARGLGSSVTVIGGVLGGLNALSGVSLSGHQLVAIATAIEGHPDNAAAGILGGFCVARCDATTGAYVDTVRVELPEELAFVATSPDVEMLTKESRGVLPATLPYFDAVKSINSTAYLVAAMVSGEYERLRHSVTDYMHEPYRLPRIPGGRSAITAGVAAGAYTGWLSGSGSTVLCVAPKSVAGEVARAMQAAFTEAGLTSTARVLSADNTGLTVE